MRELAVVVPDQEILAVISTLLTKRVQSLGIRSIEFDPRQDVKREAGRDAGCYHRGVAMLGPMAATHRHGLLILDEQWEGSPGFQAIESQLKKSLATPWGDSAEVVVIAPELEVWAFVSTDEHLARALRWPEKLGLMSAWLEARGSWVAGESKPRDPKSALHECAAQGGVRIAPRWFEEFAGGRVGLSRCTDRAFVKLVSTLRRWFPQQP